MHGGLSAASILGKSELAQYESWRRVWDDFEEWLVDHGIFNSRQAFAWKSRESSIVLKLSSKMLYMVADDDYFGTSWR